MKFNMEPGCSSFSTLWPYMAVTVLYFEQYLIFVAISLLQSKCQSKEMIKTQQRKLKAETTNPFLLNIRFPFVWIS